MTTTTTDAPRVAVLHVHDQRPQAPDFQRRLDELNAATLAQIEALGWSATLIPSADVPLKVSVEAVETHDAVVLMGGEDVHPVIYGGQTGYVAEGAHALTADLAQMVAIERAVELGRPLLGICRGAQLINVVLGGTMVQHLDSPHRDPEAPHAPFVESDVQVSGPQGMTSASVLCSHHQAVDRPAEGLDVVARHGDGTVEAFEHRDLPIIGVQWHPEHPAVAAEQLPALLRRLAPTG